jgi:hypothetical protein
MLKLSETLSQINDGIQEIEELAKKEFSFLDGYEKIDCMPEPESVEIFTFCGREHSSCGHTTCVNNIEDLIPTHLAAIKEQLLKGKRVYVRIMPELTANGIAEIGLYTRLILVG